MSNEQYNPNQPHQPGQQQGAQGQPPHYTQRVSYAPPPPPARRGRTGFWILAFLLAVSLVGNFLLLMAVMVLVRGGPSEGREQKLQEVVVESADTSKRIALLRIEGIIVEELSGRLTPSGADYEFVKKQVDQIIADERVKAVVVVVNSPGGGASASDMILKQLRRLRDERGLPVVVQMGSLAASGGYYVAMAGEYIFAQPTTITGSIGVVAQFFSLENLLSEKLGVETYIIESGERKTVGSPFRDMTQEEYGYLQETIVMPMYERFIEVIMEGRKSLDESELREVADGRIMNADQAKTLGLIDAVGFREDAIEYAKGRARLKEATIVQYQRQVGLLDVLGLSAGRAAPDMSISADTLQRMAAPRVLMQWMP